MRCRSAYLRSKQAGTAPPSWPRSTGRQPTYKVRARGRARNPTEFAPCRKLLRCSRLSGWRPRHLQRAQSPSPRSSTARAARGWLGWSQAELARRANVSVGTVRSFEAKQREPIANNVVAMRRVIEAAGVRLLFDQSGNAAGIARQDAGTDFSSVAG